MMYSGMAITREITMTTTLSVKARIVRQNFTMIAPTMTAITTVMKISNILEYPFQIYVTLYYTIFTRFCQKPAKGTGSVLCFFLFIYNHTNLLLLKLQQLVAHSIYMHFPYIVAIVLLVHQPHQGPLQALIHHVLEVQF